MNRKQRIVILSGVVIIAFMLLVPPYKTYRQGGEGGESAGYGLLFEPSIRVDARLVSDGVAVTFPRSRSVYIDLPRLLVQILLISVLTAGLCMVIKSP